MNSLRVRPIKTPIFHLRENLVGFILDSIDRALVGERHIIAVTSKIVSLAEGQTLPRELMAKEALVRQESDVFLGQTAGGHFLTIKQGLLIPSAGIDESNSANGDYILYPRQIFRSAEKLWRELRSAWGLHDLGILITDSHATPLRRGVSGVCLGYWGFRPVSSLIGQEDLFGRKLKHTQINHADALAAAAVMMMGEGKEAQPLATIANANVSFCEDADPRDLSLPLSEDIYAPLFTSRLGDICTETNLDE